MKPPLAPSRLLSVRRHYRYLLLFFVVITILSGGAFAALETDNVVSFWDGLWWALSLMTTVGFIGETPESTGGRLVSAFLMIAGFGLLSLTTAALASLFVREEEEPESQREQAFEEIAIARLDELSQRLQRIEQSMPALGTEGPHEPG